MLLSISSRFPEVRVGCYAVAALCLLLVGCGSDGSAQSCGNVLYSCFAASKASVAKYRGNKTAAASYTFDDGTASSPKIAGFFTERGLHATFFVIPGIITDWTRWQALAASGHEIGNHSMHHLDLSVSTLTDADLDLEINGAQQVIEQEIGIRPLTFAFPQSRYSARAVAVVNQHHIVARVPGFSDDPTYRVFTLDSLATLDATNAALTDTITRGGWFVAAGHGVDGDGHSPITSQLLTDHLDFARQHAADLWIDTFVEVARYRVCRDKAVLQTEVSATGGLLLTLQGNSLDPAICTESLTVVLPIVQSFPGSIQVRTALGADVPVSQNDSGMVLDMYPGEKISLEAVSAKN